MCLSDYPSMLIAANHDTGGARCHNYSLVARQLHSPRPTKSKTGFENKIGGMENNIANKGCLSHHRP